MAQNDDLIQEMVQAASTTSHAGVEAKRSPYFDVLTFANGLTRDMELFDISNETRVSTSVDDVFERHIKSDHQVITTPAAAASPEDIYQLPTPREANTLNYIYSAPSIDVQAGNYRSKALTVCLWASSLFGSFSAAFQIRQPLKVEEVEVTDDLVLANYTAAPTSPVCGELDYDQSLGGNVSELSCRLGISVYTSLGFFASFSLAGICFMGLGSLGNYVGNTKCYLPLLGAFFSLVLSFGFTTEQELQDRDGKVIESSFRMMVVLCRLLGCVVAYFHLCNFAAVVSPKTEFHEYKWGRWLGLAPLGREAHVKSAGAHKVNLLVRNAMVLMETQGVSTLFKTYFGHGLSAFAVSGTTEEQAGSFTWLFRKMRDQSILKEEGIWYSTRLLVSVLTQLSIALFIILLGTSSIQRVDEQFGIEKAQSHLSDALDNAIQTSVTTVKTTDVSAEISKAFASTLTSMGNAGLFGFDCSNTTDGVPYVVSELCGVSATGSFDCSMITTSKDSLCLLIQNPDLIELDTAAAYQLLDATEFNTTYMADIVQEQLEFVVNQSVDSMYTDKKYMVTTPLYVAVLVAMINALWLSVSYIPSITTTILELRSGVIPSLKSPDFEKYRVAPDTVSMLTGSLFWGCLVSSLLLGLVIGFVVFLFLWQGSEFTMIRALTVLLAAFILAIVKVLIIIFCCRSRYYRGLYRIKPAASNISLLALERANFVLSSAFIIVRLVKITLISLSSIGKIDRRLLADGVGQIGAFEFDPYPTMHVRDLVAQEAHRHPYIEMLGTIYLMKLRYSNSFGSRAGSAWRLMFVYALLPWTRQYRIQDGAGTEDGPETIAYPVKATADADENPSSAAQEELLSMKALEDENKKLKKKVKKLSQQLRELERPSPSLTAYDYAE